MASSTPAAGVLVANTRDTLAAQGVLDACRLAVPDAAWSTKLTIDAVSNCLFVVLFSWRWDVQQWRGLVARNPGARIVTYCLDDPCVWERGEVRAIQWADFFSGAIVSNLPQPQHCSKPVLKCTPTLADGTTHAHDSSPGPGVVFTWTNYYEGTEAVGIRGRSRRGVLDALHKLHVPTHLYYRTLWGSARQEVYAAADAVLNLSGSDAEGYVNQRIVDVLAAGGVLITDRPVPGLLRHGENCIVIADAADDVAFAARVKDALAALVPERQTDMRHSARATYEALASPAALAGVLKDAFAAAAPAPAVRADVPPVAVVGWQCLGNPNVIGAVLSHWTMRGRVCKFIAGDTASRHPESYADCGLVVWWNWVSIPGEVRRYAQASPRHSTLHVLFNWDDPFCWRVADNKCAARAALMDGALVASMELGRYAAAGVKYVASLMPPVSCLSHRPDLHPPREDVDVVFLTTNLYDVPPFTDAPVAISRVELVRALDAAPDIRFALYGVPALRDVAPSSYRGFMRYEESASAFYNAKLSLTTHVTKSPGYLNERCVTVLAAGGVLLIDDVLGVEETRLKHNQNCIVMDCTSAEAALDSIRAALALDTTAIRAAAVETAKAFSSDAWIDAVEACEASLRAEYVPIVAE